ncbi:MAG: nucleotidyltransferase family protein, partial [Oscillospiraceae bacterium]|nr:nucleotidyltransferase family protein [Oscillospiraceae bacterium]
ITEYFGDGSRLGVALQYRVEKEALGTAGGVKNCADFYGDEDFLVISGDAACDLDLGELMRRHRAGGAAATIALYREAEPLSYGLAVTDGGGLVRAFVEKPRWSRVVTDHVNTGIYALSPRAMELVPPGKPFDFANDLFPLLLARGERILGTALDGYWCDVGTPLSYYRCCVDALEGRLALDLPEGFAPAAPPESADAAEGCAACLDCACRSRAELMGALSEALLDMGADYSDGIRLRGGAFDLHIAPLSASSAIRISVSSEDAEFARELAASAKELAEAYDL